MVYRISADIVLLIHLCFVIFVIFGGFLVLCRRWLVWLHVPALIWGVLIEIFYFICPLTYLENWLRTAGGATGYTGGFIDYYVSTILYLDISHFSKNLLALLLIMTNLAIYYYIYLHRRLS